MTTVATTAIGAVLRSRMAECASRWRDGRALRWFASGALRCSSRRRLCSVGPDYVRPTAPIARVTAYKELEGWKAAEPRDEVAARRRGGRSTAIPS